MPTRLTLLLLALAFASAGTFHPLRSDEVWSLWVTGLGYSQMMEVLRADVHPPLYYLLLLAWTSLAGSSEWALRAFSTSFYIASVLPFYACARRFASSSTALLCTVLLLASPLALLSAHFSRMYSLLLLLSILSTSIFLQMHAGAISRRKTVLFLLANICGTFTHIWFFFLLCAQLAVAAALPRRLSRIRCAALIGLSVFPYSLLWLPTLLRQLGRSAETAAWLSPPGPADAGAVLLMYAGVLWLLVPLIAASWWKRGALRSAWSRPLRLMRPAILLLAATLLIPLCISFFKPVFYSRFTIVALPLFSLAAGILAARLIGTAATRQLTIVAVLLSAGFTAATKIPADRCDSRLTAAYLRSHAAPDDYVIYTSLSRLPTEYYLRRTGALPQATSFPSEIDQHPGYEGRFVRSDRAAGLRPEAESLAARLAAKRPRKIFLLHGYRNASDQVLQQALARQFQPVKEESRACASTTNYYSQITVFR